MPDQEQRCPQCYHPSRHVEGHDGLHNKGCPTADPKHLDEWRRGYTYGFDDNHIEASQYRFHSPAFILGWRVGKDEIDGLVDDAAQSRYC